MLIASIHDVAPPFLPEVRELRRRLDTWGVGAVTLLAVPDYHGRAPIADDLPTVSWLRRQHARGDEIALHGLIHRQDEPARRRRDRWRAAALTAGEGEMLGAGAADPCRLAAARARLTRLLDGPIDGFVAPAWLEPAGFAAVLAGLGFAWHETALTVESLVTDQRRRHRAPVIGFATRTWWRALAAIAWSAALAPVLARLPRASAVRLALHPADLRDPAVMHAAERAARRLLARHPAVTTSTALHG